MALSGESAQTRHGDGGDHLELVAAMTSDFADSQDVDATLELGLERIVQALEAEAASLFLRVEGDPSTLVCRACYGPVDVSGLRLSADTGIVGRTVALQSAQIVRDVSQDPDFGALVDAQTGFTTRSILCAPMRVRGETLGAIELINKRGEGLFDESDRRLLETLASAAALAVLNARMADAMVERARLKREIELAAGIQRSFLPAPRSDDFPIHGINWPAREASGDFFDILEVQDGGIWFNVGDVAGKGVNAALIMAKTASLFRYIAKQAADPWEVLRALNAALYEFKSYGMFVTMTCGLLMPDRRSACIASAGHEPALLRACDGSKSVYLDAEAPPLGVLPELTGAPAAAAPLTMVGRRLYIYSDGLTETPGPDGGELGAYGLEQEIAAAEAAAESPDDTLRRTLSALMPAEDAPADDLTLLLVRGATT